MFKTKYVELSEVNEPQRKIMEYIDIWVHEEKTTIPLKKIIENMLKKDITKETTIYSLKSLIQKGFIRRSTESSNKTRFVQLRRV